MGNKPLEKNNVDMKVDEVIKIDREKKQVETKGNESIGYDKLIIATGSNPIIPHINGIEKQGVYSVQKEMDHLKNLKADIDQAKDIVIVGGGFIGIEFADELSTLKKVSIVEFLPEILANSFDQEFSKLAAEDLTKKGVNLITGKKVVKFNGGERVESISLSDSTEIPCQVVILGIGASPNSQIAAKAGLDIGKSGGILVDEYLRTYSDENIFAVGDCAEKRDFFTRKRIPVMLASTATAEARIAGANLFELKVVRENKGTIAIYSTRVGNLTLGSAGLTEKTARKEGFEIIVGNAECVDKHPGAIPGANKIKIKLIFSKQSEILLGSYL
jgi:NADPH-dependent 2,4-dienoyl-CoA reductase/sulfur reductase-like enzyme